MIAVENQEIKYMLAVAQYGNITRAAQSLYISQPALSRYLKDKEKEIGGQLFTRDKHRFVPTELGKIYLEYAAKIVGLEKRCNEAIHSHLLKARLKIKVGIPASRAMTLTPFLVQIQALNPSYEMEVLTNHSYKIWEMALGAELDIALSELSRGY